MNLAVVFPRANRRAGVERVAWDLAHHLTRLHQVAFVGIECEDTDAMGADFFRVGVARRGSEVRTFSAAATAVLSDLRPDLTISLGVECPPGDVCWVQSVHRSFLAQGIDAVVKGRAVPARVRYLLPRHRFLLQAEKRYYSSPSLQHIMCTSQREIDDVVSLYGAARDRCTVVPNGFDPQEFNSSRAAALRSAERDRLRIPDGAVSLLFVGNELHRKGFGAVIEAIARSKAPNLRLDVVGRVEGGDYSRRINRLGLADRIYWHGSTSEVARFYAAADVMVLPTRYEPFGIVIVEALASGLPVITSRLSGAAVALDGAGAGLLLDDPTDVDELARAITMASDPGVRSAWAAAAPTASEPYAWPGVAGRVQAVIEQLASGVARREDFR